MATTAPTFASAATPFGVFVLVILGLCGRVSGAALVKPVSKPGGQLSGSKQIETATCRLSMAFVSRCVEPPVAFINETDFCTYHFCGPSYIAADECPTNGEPAADYKCMVIPVPKNVWQCVLNEPHVDIQVPGDCVGDECKKHVCPCYQKSVVQKRYSRIFMITPNCTGTHNSAYHGEGYPHYPYNQ